MRKRTCAYQGVINVNFLEDFATKWMTPIETLTLISMMRT